MSTVDLLPDPIQAAAALGALSEGGARDLLSGDHRKPVAARDCEGVSNFATPRASNHRPGAGLGGRYAAGRGGRNDGPAAVSSGHADHAGPAAVLSWIAGGEIPTPATRHPSPAPIHPPNGDLSAARVVQAENRPEPVGSPSANPFNKTPCSNTINRQPVRDDFQLPPKKALSRSEKEIKRRRQKAARKQERRRTRLCFIIPSFMVSLHR